MVKAVAALTAAVALPLVVALLAAATPASPAQAINGVRQGGTPSTLARQDIPANYLAWYMAAAQTCPGLPWSVLAGIGKIESNHGRAVLPGVRSGANSAGAEGPMQFLPATFARYAVNADPSQPLTPTTQPTRSTPQPGCCARTGRAAALAWGSTRPSSLTTTPPGTSLTYWPGRPGTRPRRSAVPLTAPIRVLLPRPPTRGDRSMSTWTPEAIRALGPTTDLPTLGSIFDCSRWKAYEMARSGEWETIGVRIVRLGSKYRVVVLSILEVLGYAEILSRGSNGDAASPSGQARR